MKTKQVKSIKINMVLNAIKGILSVLFPLISFPYVSRILGVDSLGKYNFATSIISYFILLAGLGVNIYAVRECARFRDDREKLNRLANQIFSINLMATIISYLLLFLLMWIVPKFHEYTVLLIILSLQIVFRTIGIEWLYSVYEDYLYITIRSILFQIFSLVALFLFVKTKNDLNLYAIITVLANVGSNLLNYIHSKKYCNIKFTKDMDLKRHLKPILILFAMNVTVSIYVNSDITILGFLKGDYSVGIYSVSSKIYTIVKSLLSSIIIVSIPRLSYLLRKKDKEEFNKVASEIYKMLITILLPAVVGIILLSEEIILVISSESYLEAATSLVLLGISLVSVYGAYFWSQCILIPFKKDSEVLKATIVSSLVNIVLNFILIPKWGQNAAAFTTIVAETIVFIWCYKKSRKLIELETMTKILVKTFIGCIGIVIVIWELKYFIHNIIPLILLSILVSVVVYGVIEIILKNEVVCSIIEKIMKKLIKNE